MVAWRVGCVGDDGHMFLVKHSLVKKEKCETVRCRDATISPFVITIRGEVFAHFHAVAIKRHSIMRNWQLGLSGQFASRSYNTVQVEQQSRKIWVPLRRICTNFPK
jgi:hypothetical protein